MSIEVLDCNVEIVNTLTWQEKDGRNASAPAVTLVQVVAHEDGQGHGPA